MGEGARTGYVSAHAVWLVVVLMALWLVLSGHYTPLLIGFGVACALGVTALALRMEVIDHESYPMHLRPWRVAGYWLWLGWEIVKSNLDVAWRILDPRLPIHPSVIRVRAGQRSELGRVIYANSITLTPGTVSIDVSDEHDAIEVHALTRGSAAGVESGDMDRRVSALESRD